MPVRGIPAGNKRESGSQSTANLRDHTLVSARAVRELRLGGRERERGRETHLEFALALVVEVVPVLLLFLRRDVHLLVLVLVPVLLLVVVVVVVVAVTAITWAVRVRDVIVRCSGHTA